MKFMSIISVTKTLNKYIQNPCVGLPDKVFYFISRLTPLVNVDLLIRDEKGRTLLSWRDDKYTGKGWHIPSGIVRFKETLETRVKKVAKTEADMDVKFEKTPITIKQCIHNDRDTRGHFISILYKCYLPSTFIPLNKNLSKKQPRYLKWHISCPKDLIKAHDMYKEFI